VLGNAATNVTLHDAALAAVALQIGPLRHMVQELQIGGTLWQAFARRSFILTPSSIDVFD
jgi:hypothetical protein